MDFRQLRYFTQIAEIGNMTRTAEIIRVAQPALSQQISALETDLRTRLFDRNNLGVKLTPAGGVLYKHAKSLLRQLDDARSAVQGENDRPSGKVSVGIAGSTGKVVAIPLLRNVAAAGDIMLEIVERPSSDLLSLVAHDRLDIAIVVDAQSDKRVRTVPLISEDLYAILHSSHQPDESPISLRTLSTLPLILPTVPSTIRQRTDLAFIDARLTYRLVGEVSATDMLVRMVAAGLGATILPWAAISEEVERGIVRATAIDRTPLSRELSLCESNTVALSRSGEIVRRLILETMSDLVASGSWKGIAVVGSALAAGGSVAE